MLVSRVGKGCIPLIICFDFHLQEYSKECVAHVNSFLQKNEVPTNLFEPYIEEIFNHLRSDPFKCFMESSRYTRFLQWKNLELNLKVSCILRCGREPSQGRLIVTGLNRYDICRCDLTQNYLLFIADYERLQCSSHHWTRRLRRGVWLPKSGHRQDVRDEMPR